MKERKKPESMILVLNCQRLLVEQKESISNKSNHQSTAISLICQDPYQFDSFF